MQTALPSTTFSLVGDILCQIRKNARRILPLCAVIWLLQFPSFVGDMDAIPVAALTEMGLPPGPASQIPAIIVLLATYLGTAWCAVGWHRLTILGEEPGPVLPRWHPGRIFAYFGAAIILGLVSWLPVGLLAMLVLFVASQLGASTLVSIMLMPPLAVLAIWLNLRLSPIMVGAAVQRRTNIDEAFRMTSPMTRPIWGLACLGTLLLGIELVVISSIVSKALTDPEGYYRSYMAMYLDAALSMLIIFVFFLLTIAAYNVIYRHANIPSGNR